MLVQCELCPKSCLIEHGQSGDCRVRVNIEGVLRTVVYSHPVTCAVDPIEKKPMFHFLPGTEIFSLATVGCNLHCKNCQNWEISQADPAKSPAYLIPPENLVWMAMNELCPSIAYTYNDPIVFYEYTYDTAKLARKYGLYNVLVTAGYINPAPWKQLLEYVDGANIDLKSIRDDFYREVCSATLKPIQTALVIAKESGIIVEVTNLVIPTLNDSEEEFKELTRWIKENLGSDTPLHFSGFRPEYKMDRLPPTSEQTLNRAREIARSEGLKYVYIGNALSKEGQSTYCPNCGLVLIERGWRRVQGRWNNVYQNRLRSGCCPKCNTSIYGVWQ